MAHLFGVRPWEWDRLTVTEVDYLIAWADDYNENRGADGG